MRIRNELNISVDCVGNDLAAVKAYPNAVVFDVLEVFLILQVVVEFSKHLKEVIYFAQALQLLLIFVVVVIRPVLLIM